MHRVTIPRKFAAGEVVQRTTGLVGRFKVVTAQLKDDNWRCQILAIGTNVLEWVAENEIILSTVH